MPMFQVGCICGYRDEWYLHNEFHRQELAFCPECKNTISYIPSFGVPMRYFEESRPRTIYNMGDEPVTITSPSQHEQEMKKHGVALAGSRYGEKGCWV